LGVKVIKDRNAKRIFLIHDAYIEKIARRFALDNNALIPAIPIPIEEHLLRKTPSIATHAEMHIYQELMGSIIYTAVTIRPNVAWAAALLLRFLINPLHQHIAAAKQYVRYLYSTRFLAIIYNGSIINALMIAIDASFDDDPYIRKFLYGYIITMCEGFIMWRSGLQDGISTLTTEAKLKELAAIIKESLAFERFLRDIEITFTLFFKVYYDNQQTIRLIIDENKQFNIKLRHIDINNM
jgi:hypothetical protein